MRASALAALLMLVASPPASAQCPPGGCRPIPQSIEAAPSYRPSTWSTPGGYAPMPHRNPLGNYAFPVAPTYANPYQQRARTWGQRRPY